MSNLNLPDLAPAELVSRTSHVVPGQLHITELFFRVPLDHHNPSSRPRITLFGRLVRKNERPVDPSKPSPTNLPYLVYLEGGPGFGNRQPQHHPLTSAALARGYQVLYLDYRGTGLSTPVDVYTIAPERLPAEIAPGEEDAVRVATYLSLFRADSIVHDLEAVRLYLTQYAENKKWSLLGQSFGGFVATTYLSYYPSSLAEVFITGGLPPIKRTAHEVYTRTFATLRKRNEAYYKKFPEDVKRVRRIASFIHNSDPTTHSIPLPAGGRLTVPGFLALGIAFGTHGGLDEVHNTVLRMDTDLEIFGFLTRGTLAAVEAGIAWEGHPIYALLHECIYFANPPTRRAEVGEEEVPEPGWAAYQVGALDPHFSWLRGDEAISSLLSSPETPLYFSGEMIFPIHISSSPSLSPFLGAANLLSNPRSPIFSSAFPLYDPGQLSNNRVPVYALSYIEDMYVDISFARETASMIKGIKVLETNGFYHDAVRSRAEEVLGLLWRLRDDEVD